VSWIFIPSWVIIKFFLLFPVIGLYFLIVVKSYYSDLKERQNNNAEKVWKSKKCEYSEVSSCSFRFLFIYLYRINFKATYVLNPWSIIILEKLSSELVKKFPAFMEPESSSPYPQVPATCPYPEPTPSNPHDPLQLPEDLS
jgi:hypothetical protein